MTNQQILEKAIQKAIDGGWHINDLNNLTNLVQIRLLYKSKKKNEQLGRYEQFVLDAPLIPPFIFNHDFAKALWPLTLGVNYELYTPAWKTNLQQMVIADNPIKYLGENL